MTWLTDHPALVWLGVALLLAAAEVATLNLVLIMFAVGALVAALVAALGGAVVLQVVALVVVAVLLLGVVRPSLLRRMRSGPDVLTGAAALVGRDARVVETVTDTGGRIRLQGEVWSARTHGRGPAATILPGQSVRVVAIEGATAVVAVQDPGAERSS